jgi:AraC-like DNA-binding protein
MRYLPLTSARTPKLIRQNDPEYYQLSLTVHGRMGLSHSGHEVALGTGDLVLYDSSRPFDGWAASETGAVAHIVAQVPKTLVPIRPNRVDRLIATRIPGDRGFGELLAQFLTQVTAKAHQYRPSDTGRLSTIILDLLAATVAQRLDDHSTLALESRQHALFLRVQAFIQQHLGDPELSPGLIAAAHHISTRSLHRLFQNQDTTAAAYIRQQRLERARRDLADPLLCTRPIHATARRWGFTRPADFTRAFRTAYGISPKEFQNTVLHSDIGTQR